MILTRRKICSGAWPILFFLIAIEPAAFMFYRVTDVVYEMCIFAMFGLVGIFHLDMCLKYTKCDSESFNSRVPYLIFLYYGYLLLDTIYNDGQIKYVVMRGVQFTNFAMYLDLILKSNPKAFFKTGLNILSFFVFLNFLCYFAFPSGLYADERVGRNYLLGYDNQNINFLLPAMLLVLIKNRYYQKCKFHIIFIYAVSLITVIKAWSGMSLCVATCTVAFAYLICRKDTSFVVTKLLNGRIFNLRNLCIFNIISFVSLVFFHIEQYLKFLIVGVLGKSLTLTGRVTLWGKVLKYIEERPIFGYGQEIFTERAIKMGFSKWSTRGLHAHNRFLEVMYTGGVVLVAIYLYMIYYTIRCLRPVRDTFLGKTLAFGLFIYMMGMLTEMYPYSPFFWGFMVIAENAKNCIKMSPLGENEAVALS